MSAPGDSAPLWLRLRAHEGWRAWALFLCFCGCYLLTVSGHYYTVDEETLYLMTENLVERGNLALPPNSWGVVGQYGLVIAPNSTPGPIESIFTPGQPIMAIPLYLVGRAIAPLFPPGAHGYVTRFVVSLFGSFVSAATVALLYRLARQFGYRGGAALGLAAIYGLATTAWPHSRTFLAEPLTALLLLFAFYALRRGADVPGRAGWFMAAGLALALACLTKPHALIALPPLGGYLLWAAGLGRADLRRVGINLAAWCGGGALVLLAFMGFNLALYGEPLRLGYGNWPLALFNNPFWKGLYGLTISSGKGIVWYAPPVLLGLAAIRPFSRRHRAEALTCLALVVIHLLFYSKLRFWHGDWIWGPRFLLMALPFTLLPAVAILEGLRARPGRLALVAVVVVAGIGVQLLGSGVNFAWYIIRSSDAEARFFQPASSPLLVHAEMAAARWSEWREQTFPPPDVVQLTSGFAAAEDGPALLFPRWTNGEGTITMAADTSEAQTVKLTFFDHRPVALRTTPPSIVLNGAVLPDAAIDRHDFSGTGEGWTYTFTVPSKPGGRTRQSLILRSSPWNPHTLGVSDRNEEIGVFVHNIEVWRGGKPLTVEKAHTIPPLPAGASDRHWWFNDDRAADAMGPNSPAHQLDDWWAWYAANAGLGATTRPWIVSFSLVGTVPLLAGLWIGLLTRTPHAVRRKHRQPVRA